MNKEIRKEGKGPELLNLTEVIGKTPSGGDSSGEI